MGSFLAFSSWQLLLLIISLAVFLIPGWQIARKAGYPGAVSLLLFIPMLNIIFLWVFAFSRWPNQREGTEGVAGTRKGMPPASRSAQTLNPTADAAAPSPPTAPRGDNAR